jgi:hypothetical protein
MRRNQLIQIAILVIALICGYKFIETLIGVLIVLLFQFGEGLSSSLDFIFRYLIFLGIYCAAFFLLIRYNKQIADYIDKQGELNTTAASELVSLRIQQGNLLYIVLIAVCLITLIEDVPVIILSVYNYFKKEAGGYGARSVGDLNFKTVAIKFVFTMIVLFTSKSISGWFSRQFSSDKPILETLGEPDETNNLNL